MSCRPSKAITCSCARAFANVICNALTFSASREQPAIEVGVPQRLRVDEQFDGTRIGLTNVRRIVERQGAKM